MTFFITAFVLMVFLYLVSAMQRDVDNEETEHLRREMREAKECRSDKPLFQHPIIRTDMCIGCGSCVDACPEKGVLKLVGGVSTVVHGARCIGLGCCEEACPVGALKVSLGDISARPDIPIRSETLETSLPGLYIAGELGGVSLIRNAINEGARAIDQIAQKVRGDKTRRKGDIVDVLIVGAGPAGLSASLKAVDLGLSCLTIAQEDIGGTICKYPRRKLVLLQDVEIPLYGTLSGGEYLKEDLLKLWVDTIQKFRLPMQINTRLQSLKKNGAVFETQTSAGPIRSRFVLLAMGRRGTPRRLGISGETRSKVLYDLLDAHAYAHENLLVVGGGDSAIEAATSLAEQSGNSVALSYRKPNFFRLKARNERKIKEYSASGRVRVFYNSNVLKIDDDSVTLGRGGKEVPAAQDNLKLRNSFVFVFAGGEPPYPMLQKIGIRFGGARATAA